MAETPKSLLWSPTDLLDPYVEGFRDRWDNNKLTGWDLPMAAGTSLTNMFVGGPVNAALDIGGKLGDAWKTGHMPTDQDIIPMMTSMAEFAVPGVAGAATKVVDPNTLFGISAWHGSPHKFAAERLVETPDGPGYITGDVDRLPDVAPEVPVVKDLPFGRFRDDKILSGTGANAFGRGHYTAERQDTALGYRDMLAKKVPTVRGVPLKEITDNDRLTGLLSDTLDMAFTYGDMPLAKALDKARVMAADEYNVALRRVEQHRQETAQETINELLGKPKNTAGFEKPSLLDEILTEHGVRTGEPYSPAKRGDKLLARLDTAEEAHNYLQMLDAKDLELRQGGGLYELDLNADPTRDFISHNEVIAAQDNNILDRLEAGGLLNTDDVDAMFNRPLMEYNFENPDIVKQVHDTGIKGIKVPDIETPQSNRLYNYIMFSGDDIDILNRTNAMTGLPGMGGLLRGEEDRPPQGDGLLTY